MNKINEKNYLQFLASFLIVLVLTLPFYSVSVFAQVSGNGQNNIPDVEEAAEACVKKNEKTSALADLMDNEIISTLEKLLRVMHALDTIWQSQVVVIDTIILAYYAFPETFLTKKRAKDLEDYRNRVENPFSGGLADLMNYLLTCQLPGGLIGLCNLKVSIGDTGVSLRLDAFDNIYTAVGCLCLPGILFNLRKLNTVYKTYNCCIEEACENGISTESCEQEFDKAQCMTIGSGAIYGALIRMLLNVGISLVYKLLLEDYVKRLPPLVGTLISLGNVYFKIQGLIAAWEKITTTFKEPKCEDLGFDKLKNKY